MQSRDSRAKKRLTVRSSSEWNEMTASRPPGRRIRDAAARPRSRFAISPFTAMRSAWNTLVAGSIDRRRRSFTPATKRPNDRGRHAPRLRLFAVLGEHAAEVALAPAVHDVGRRVAKVRVGTHIQRASRAKAEAALLVGELDGREPEIQKDAVDRNEVVRAGHDVAGREVSSNEARPIPEARELGGGGGETRGVDVESQETPGRNAPFEDRCGVSARADRAVEVASAIARLEPRENFGHENRFMSALGGLAPQFGATRSRGP